MNERDELGSDLVPDYLTSVKAGAFYGWPYSYFGKYVDTRVKPPRPDLVAKALVPDYALGAHVAPLGLAFYEGQLLPPRYAGGAFVGEHGSWNRRPLSGYKVVFVASRAAAPSGLRKTSSAASSTRTAMRAGARWASRWTAARACSSPTTSATSFGA